MEEIAKWTGAVGVIIFCVVSFGKKFIAATFLQQLTKEQSYNVIRLVLYIIAIVSVVALLVAFGNNLVGIFKKENVQPAKIAEAIIEKARITKDNLDVANYISFYNHEKIDSSRTPCIQLKLTNTGEKPAFITHIDLIVDRVVSLKKPGPQVEAVVPDSRKYKIEIEPKRGIYTVQTENGISKENPFDRFVIQFMEKEHWTTSSSLYFCKLCIHVNGDGGTFYSKPFAFAVGIHHGLIVPKHLEYYADLLSRKDNDSYVSTELKHFESFASIRTENNEIIAKEIKSEPPPLLLSEEISKIVTPFEDASLELPNPKPVLSFKFERCYFNEKYFNARYPPSAPGSVWVIGRPTNAEVKLETSITGFRFYGIGTADQLKDSFPAVKQADAKCLTLEFLTPKEKEVMPQKDVRMFYYQTQKGKYGAVSDKLLDLIIARSIKPKTGICRLTTKESDEVHRSLASFFNIKTLPDSDKRSPLRIDGEESIHPDYIKNK